VTRCNLPGDPRALDILLDPVVVLEPAHGDGHDSVLCRYANSAAHNYPPQHELTHKLITDTLPDPITAQILTWAAQAQTGQQPRIIDDTVITSAADDQISQVRIRLSVVDGLIYLTWRNIDHDPAHLLQQAQTDALTGLLNRREGLHRLEQALHQHRRAGTHLAVLFCDLDGFKQVNDDLGHQYGDAVLTTVAGRVIQSVRAHDYVIRIGGDEMLIVLDGITDMSAALTVADKIRTSISEPLNVEDHNIELAASIGVVLARRDDTVNQIINRADHAMYQAKAHGGNQATVYQNPK